MYKEHNDLKALNFEDKLFHSLYIKLYVLQININITIKKSLI